METVVHLLPLQTEPTVNGYGAHTCLVKEEAAVGACRQATKDPVDKA
jgi:hypothetical protein